MTNKGYLVLFAIIFGRTSAEFDVGGSIGGSDGGSHGIGGSAIQEQTRLIYTERTAEGKSQISSVPADGTPGASITSTRHFYHTSDEPREWAAITSDYFERLIFFIDQTNSVVFKGYFDTHGESIFSGTSDIVQGIAVDWLRKYLYYADATYDWIVLSDYGHEKHKVIVDTGLDKPHGLAVFPQKGYLFWTDWGMTPKIERSTLAGKSRTVLVSTGLYQPNGITIDYSADRLYWVESNNQYLSRLRTCDLDGNSIRTLTTTTSGSYTDLALFQNTVFISDSKNKKIYYINKNDGSSIYIMAMSNEPHGLTVYGPNQLPTESTPSPCSSNPCEHFCVNQDMAYQCLCMDDYTLENDGRTCIRSETFVYGRLYYIKPTSICSHFGNFAELTESNDSCITTNRKLAVAMALDTRGRMLFYSDYDKRAIYRARLSGGESINRILGGVGSVEGLAVDWLNKNLYWTDNKHDHIAVSRYDGSYRRILISENVYSPRSIVIHPGQRLMFWTELESEDGSIGQIEKAGLDGSNRQVIVSSVESANGLTIDFENNRLYFADRGTSSIAWVDFNGNSRTVVYTRAGAEFFDLAINRDYLIWTEWGVMKGIHVINKETKEYIKHIPSDTDLYDVELYDPVNQPDGNSVCGSNNGGCDHLCLPFSAGSYQCACATGYTLQTTSKCVTNVQTDNFMLLADSGIKGIYQMNLDDTSLPFTALPLQEVVNPFCVTYNPKDNKIYWGDTGQHSINRANLDGTNQEELIGSNNGVQSPEGITIEPSANLLFWTDFDRKTISVSTLEGRFKKTLVSTNLDKPRGIVVDEANKKLYWSDYGLRKIERSSLDGTQRQTIASGTGVSAPNGLALWTPNGANSPTKLYYCEPLNRKVMRMNLDGSDREVFYDLPAGFLPIGIAIHDAEHIFVADWSVPSIIWAHTRDQEPNFAGPAQFGRINDLHIYSSANAYTGTNVCSANNGGCEELCFATSGGKTCGCQDDASLLSNNLNCGAPVPGTRCPQSFTGGSVEAECDRKPGSTCSVQCHSSYEKTFDMVMCTTLGIWDEPVVCEAIDACSSSPCVNGLCNNMVTYFTCSCQPGWEGLTCNIDVNECASMPCMPNGNCEDEINGYVCHCADGYNGIRCETDASTPADTTPPSVSGCPSNIMQTAAAGTTSAAVTWTPPTATDNVTPTALIQRISTHTPGQAFPIGATTVTYIFTDQANNQNTQCSFTVTVQASTPADTTPPSVSGCPANIMQTAAAGATSATATWTPPTATDNVTPTAQIQMISTHTPGQAFPIGATTVTYIFTDQANNQNTQCSFIVTVQASAPVDTTPPTVSGCPGNIIQTAAAGATSATVTWTPPTATDNVTPTDEIVIFYTHPPGVSFPIGDTTVQYFFIDKAGNQNTQCSFIVNIQAPVDNIPPILSNCPNNIYQAAAVGATSATATWTPPTATDNVTPTAQIQATNTHTPGQAFPIGDTTVTYMFVDQAGNIATCAFTVTVQATSACASDPCINGGSCEGDSSAFTCKCAPGFTGIRCETDIPDCTPTSCLNAGTCVDGLNMFTCDCQDGYTGGRCETDINECSSNPCYNAGTCSDFVNSYSCRCQDGYRGIHCEVNFDECGSNPCQNSGTCFDAINNYICICVSGFSGKNCEINVPDCEDDTCQHGGTCHDQVNGFQCECADGWTGNVCEISTNVCFSYPCDNGGSCEGDSSAFTCKCAPGFTGTRCETDINECSSSPCSNGGICHDYPNTYLCTCITGYSGTNCQTKVTCPGLTSPVNGKITPSTCSTSGSYDDICIFSCDEGDYVIAGPQVQICTSSGTWSQQGVATTCTFTDTTPPVFTPPCPLQISSIVSTPCSIHTQVTYDLPEVSDNSGIATITSAPSSEVLEVGRYERYYRTEDPVGNEAVCQIVVNVQGIDCGSPPSADINGYIASMSCSHKYGSEASYLCFPGYVLNGGSQLECGIDGNWDGVPPSCQEITCNALTIPVNGNISPTICSIGSVSTGTTCTIWCNTGYRLSGSASITCGADGRWTRQGGVVDCIIIDMSGLVFSNCPESITIELPPGSNTVEVPWTVPTATRLEQPVSVVHLGGLTPPVTLGPGTHMMEYVASDAGFQGYCNFTVTVEDTEPPEVNSCPSRTLIKETLIFPYPVEWEEPSFTDNVKVTEVLRDHQPGLLAYNWGIINVRYSAFDAAGNTAVCVVKIQIIQPRPTCPVLTAPVHGNLDCEEQIRCLAECNSGFIFTNRNQPTDAFICSQSTGIWSHGDAENRMPEMPACVESTLTNPVTWEREDIILIGGTECNAASQVEIRDRVLVTIDNGSWMTTCQSNSGNDCSVGTINVGCNTEGNGRSKRQTAADFEVKYKLVAQRQDSMDTRALAQAMSISITDMIPNDSFTISVNGQPVTLVVTVTETGDTLVICEPGYEPAGMLCVPCPVGTSFDLNSSGCSPCVIGSYQDEEAQLLCKGCPKGTSTSGTGSYDIAHCKESCPAGQFSYTGLTPCLNCPRGTVQEKNAMRGCQPCAEGYSTPISGSTSFDQCQRIGTFTTVVTTTAEFTTDVTQIGGADFPTAIVIASVAGLVIVVLVIVFICYCITRNLPCQSIEGIEEMELHNESSSSDNRAGWNVNIDNPNNRGHFYNDIEFPVVGRMKNNY